MTRKDIMVLIGLVVLCEGAGGLGSMFTRDAIPVWYATLNRPWFNPPNWLFGPVWTILYLMMAVAAWLVWRQRAAHPDEARAAFLIFALQLLTNLVWTPVFFGWQAIGLALLVIVVLLALIAATIVRFRALSVPAAWLLAPYFAWVAFATVLNGEYWKLN